MAEEKFRASLPTQEYVDLVRNTTTENVKLKAQNSELQEFKTRMSKFVEERKRYVAGLDTSIRDKTIKLDARRKAHDFPVKLRILH